MSKSNYITVKISKIKVSDDRARNLDLEWAEALAVMFKDHGNKTAIEVRTDGDDYQLVAGLHRLEGAKIAKWDELTVQLVEAVTDHEAAEFKLHEVIENIGRRELTILDRAHHFYDFQKAYETLHPELKKGGNKQTELDEETPCDVPIDARTLFKCVKAVRNNMIHGEKIKPSRDDADRNDALVVAALNVLNNVYRYAQENAKCEKFNGHMYWGDRIS